MANELNVSGRMKVKSLKEDFQEAFGVGIRVYNGQKFADDDATLASIRDEGVKAGDIEIFGQTKVKNVEQMFRENMGIKIQVENKDGDLADNEVTLGSLG